jgi:hypothetical protein
MVRRALENGGVYKWAAGALLTLNVVLLTWIVSGAVGVAIHEQEFAHQGQLEWDARVEERLRSIEAAVSGIAVIRTDQGRIRESLARIEAELGIR